MSEEANLGAGASDGMAQAVSMISSALGAESQPEKRREEAPLAAAPAGDEGEQYEPEYLDANTEANGDSEELPDTIDGLAAALEMDPEALLDHLKVKVKVNGEEKVVNLREAQKGYQLEADYRQKTAQIAQEKAQFEAGRKAADEQLNARVQHLDTLVSHFERELWGNVPDPSLAQTDPASYVAQRADFERKVGLYQAAQMERQQAHAQQQQQAQAQWKEDIVRNEKRLMEAVPEWSKDIAKGRQEISEVKQWLVKSGIPKEIAANLIDADHLLIARDAMRWRELQAKRPEVNQKLKVLPKVQVPGAATERNGTVEVQRAALNKLKKSGSVRDAAAVFKHLLKDVPR